jgi:hypothetical protein
MMLNIGMEAARNTSEAMPMEIKNNSKKFNFLFFSDLVLCFPN